RLVHERGWQPGFVSRPRQPITGDPAMKMTKSRQWSLHRRAFLCALVLLPVGCGGRQPGSWEPAGAPGNLGQYGQGGEAKLEASTKSWGPRGGAGTPAAIPV